MANSERRRGREVRTGWQFEEPPYLAHGDEDLVIDALGHAVLAHELEDRVLILRVDEALTLDQHRQQRGDHLDFFLDGEHLGVGEDGRGHVERRRHIWREVFVFESLERWTSQSACKQQQRKGACARGARRVFKG